MITSEQLLEVFAAYNPQIWPMQILAYILGVAAVYFATRNTAFSRRAIPAALAFFWLWVALMFWLPSILQGYAPGYFFVAIFLIQGALFVWQAVRPGHDVQAMPGAVSYAGWSIVLYALVGYPLVGALVGHTFPRMSPFGLTPCPVVTFTFGLLLLSGLKMPRALLMIPSLYALSGAVWVSIGMWEDIGMLVSGVVGAVLLWRQGAHSRALSGAAAAAIGDGGWSLDLPDQK